MFGSPPRLRSSLLAVGAAPWALLAALSLSACSCEDWLAYHRDGHAPPLIPAGDAYARADFAPPLTPTPTPGRKQAPGHTPSPPNIPAMPPPFRPGTTPPTWATPPPSAPGAAPSPAIASAPTRPIAPGIFPGHFSKNPVSFAGAMHAGRGPKPPPIARPHGAEAPPPGDE